MNLLKSFGVNLVMRRQNYLYYKYATLSVLFLRGLRWLILLLLFFPQINRFNKEKRHLDHISTYRNLEMAMASKAHQKKVKLKM